MFCLYRFKIAHYLSHTGKDKKKIYINGSKSANI